MLKTLQRPLQTAVPMSPPYTIIDDVSYRSIKAMRTQGVGHLSAWIAGVLGWPAERIDQARLAGTLGDACAVWPNAEATNTAIAPVVAVAGFIDDAMAAQDYPVNRVVGELVARRGDGLDADPVNAAIFLLGNGLTPRDWANSDPELNCAVAFSGGANIEYLD